MPARCGGKTVFCPYTKIFIASDLFRARRPSFTLTMTFPPASDRTETFVPMVIPRLSKCLLFFSSARIFLTVSSSPAGAIGSGMFSSSRAPHAGRSSDAVIFLFVLTYVNECNFIPFSFRCQANFAKIFIFRTKNPAGAGGIYFSLISPKKVSCSGSP